MKFSFKFPKAFIAAAGMIMMSFAMPTMAADFDEEDVLVDGIMYGIIGTEAPYTAYVVYAEDDDWDSIYTGEVTVPSTIEFEAGKTATVVGIDKGAFQSSTVTTVTLPNTVEVIEKSAFATCSKLTCLKLGSGIKTIGSKAFYPDANLATIYIDAVVPPTIAQDALPINADKVTLYVPAEAVDKYKENFIWNTVGNITTADNVVKVTEIKVTPAVATVEEMGTVQLTAVVSPANAAQAVVWSSSDTSVARVSNKGEVFGVKSGICTITASATDGSGVSGECKLTVGSGKLLQLNMPNITGYPGEEFKLSAEVSPEDATVEWSIADSKIATLTADGKKATVKLVASGKTTINVTSSNGLSQQLDVNVKELVALTDINVDPKQIEVEVDDVIRMSEFNITPVPENVSVFNPDFRIENTAIVDFDPEDEDEETFICLRPGTTKFIWSQDGIEGYCEIIVAGDIELEAITLNPDKVEGVYKAGDTIQITATPIPADATDFEPVWSSSNNSIATVNDEGLVTIVAPKGDVTIKCTSGFVDAECKITLLSTGIDEIKGNNDKYVVMSIDGMVIKKCDSKDALDSLPAGFYIVNGGKFFKSYGK